MIALYIYENPDSLGITLDELFTKYGYMLNAKNKSDLVKNYINYTKEQKIVGTRKHLSDTYYTIANKCSRACTTSCSCTNYNMGTLARIINYSKPS